MENETTELVWENGNENEEGYWICKGCGAIYRQPQNWRPYASWCMKCCKEWRIQIETK